MKDKVRKVIKARLVLVAVVCLVVIATGLAYLFKAFSNGDVLGGVLGGLVALIVLGFAMFVFVRGTSDLKHGFPIQDERSKMVMMKASSKAFFISLYLLLAVGFLSEWVMFRDVSQATGICVGLMALIFGVLWFVYNRK